MNRLLSFHAPHSAARNAAVTQSPVIYAAILSAVVHAAVLIGLNATDGPADKQNPELLLGTIVDVALVMEALDKGETPDPSTPSIESVAVPSDTKSRKRESLASEVHGTIAKTNFEVNKREQPTPNLVQRHEQHRPRNLHRNDDPSPLVPELANTVETLNLEPTLPSQTLIAPSQPSLDLVSKAVADRASTKESVLQHQETIAIEPAAQPSLPKEATALLDEQATPAARSQEFLIPAESVQASTEEVKTRDEEKLYPPMIADNSSASEHQLKPDKVVLFQRVMEANMGRPQAAELANTVETLNLEPTLPSQTLIAPSQPSLDLVSKAVADRASTKESVLQHQETIAIEPAAQPSLPKEATALLDEQATPAARSQEFLIPAESVQASTEEVKTRDAPVDALAMAEPHPTPVGHLLAAPLSSVASESGNAEQDSKPQPVSGNRKPAYPILAKKRGIEGEVHLKVLISLSGQVDTVTIEQSSGSVLLDRAAVEAVSNWRYHLPLRDGKPVTVTDIVPVQFRINSS